MEFKLTREFALECDSNDQLAGYRQKFFIPIMDDESKCIYLCGNSLGLEHLICPEEKEPWLSCAGNKISLETLCLGETI